MRASSSGRLHWWLLPIAGAMSVLGVPSDARAFRCLRTGAGTGPSLSWTGREIVWWLDAEVAELDGRRGRVEAEAGFAAWTSPDCTDLRFRLEGVEAGLAAEFRADGRDRNVVLLQVRWPYEREALAVTTSTFDTQTGQLRDADIELNGEGQVFAVLDEATCPAGRVVMDLRNTLTHEVGHLVGLDHPPPSPRYAEATMFARAAPCEVQKRTLEASDIEGVCTIYPAGAPNRPCAADEGEPSAVGSDLVDADPGCRASPSDRPVDVLAWLALALTAVGPWARTRRRR